MRSTFGRWLRLAAWLAVALLSSASQAAQTTETLTFIHTDVAGSVIGQSNAAGNVSWRENYWPYGERTVNSSGAAGNRQFFHGKAFDPDTGLSYFGARYYDPVVGRFMGVDAAGFDERNPHSFNRYAYGSNNPLRYVDRNGEAAETIIDFVSLGLSIAAYRHDPSILNALGVGYDAIAAAVPLLPGGVGILRQTARVADASASGADVGKLGEVAKNILVPSRKFPETAAHIKEAQGAGHPAVLTIDRAGAEANRAAAQAGRAKIPGKQLDEYPPAMFREGGQGASVRAVSSRDNMGAGACIGNQCRGLPEGSKVRIVVE
jgi:RHS repeat-associated protein